MEPRPRHGAWLAAWLILAVYLMVNASFLQPYLGDAGATSAIRPPTWRCAGDPQASARHAAVAARVRRLRSHRRGCAQPRHRSSPTTCCAPTTAAFTMICPTRNSVDPEFSEVDDGSTKTAPFDHDLAREGPQDRCRNVRRRRQDRTGARGQSRLSAPSRNAAAIDLAGDGFCHARQPRSPMPII